MFRPKARRLLALVAGAAAASLVLAACGSDATAGGAGEASQDTATTAAGDGATSAAPAGDAAPVTMWAVQSGHSDSYTAGADRWNAEHPDRPIQVEVMPDSGYKDKIRVALGAGQGPDVFYTWGGGGLKSYIDEGYVEPLDSYTSTYPDMLTKFLPSIMGPVQFDGTTYAVPISNVQPAVLFYNTQVFADNGLQPPTTWDDLGSLATTLNGKGIAPLTLAGQSKWPYLPYLSYLVDRIGGPEVFDKIAANEPGSWSDPAVEQALTTIQDLVKADGITPDFASLAYETGAADALLYTGKAGMLVMLASAYGNIQKANPDFVSGGGLDAVAFPAIEGGKGDPSNVVGNPAGFWAINANASQAAKDTAAEFFATIVEDDQWCQEIMDRGGVPPVVTAEEKLEAGATDFQLFVFDLAKNAKHFQQSWDQALSPEQGTALNTELDRVFLLQATPQEFIDTMNATITAS